MAFSGGGQAVTRPHTHDSTIVQDGGSLNFNNITQSSMGASSMTYSDGNHLRELTIGSAGDTLSVSGGVPAWTPHGDYPVVQLLEAYTAVATNSAVTMTISPAVNLVDEYSEIWVIANMYTNNAAGYGECYIKLNGLSAGYTGTYGYSFDGTTFTNIAHAGTNLHLVANAALTTTNSAIHSVTKISLAKTSTTTNTVYFKSDSIGDRGVSEHFESTLDLGAETVNAVRYQVSLANWAVGSNIHVYGVKQ
jgi:hypothetical protein